MLSLSIFHYSHRIEETQWESPLTGLRYKVMHGMLWNYFKMYVLSLMKGLPYGWQKFKDEDNKVVFVE